MTAKSRSSSCSTKRARNTRPSVTSATAEKSASAGSRNRSKEEIMKRLLFSSLLICLFIVQAGWAQTPAETYSDSPVLPEGVKGERIQALIATLNSGNPEQIKSFLTTHCTERFRNIAPMEDHIEVFQGLFQETGGVDFSGIRTYVPERKGQTVVIVKDRNYESYRGLTIRFADAPEYLIGGAGFRAARPPAGLKEA